MLGFTLPHHEHSPSQNFKFYPVFLISNSISLEFLFPVHRSCFRNFGSLATVLVPKTTMHEYDFSPARKNQVRTSGKRLSMQTIPIAFGMNQAADKQLRFGILASYPRHHPASMFRGQAVHDRSGGLRFRRVSARQARQRHSAMGDRPSRQGRAR